MAQETNIAWCDLTWNPTHGCSRVSTGCKHCYAETLSLRHGQTGKPWTALNAAENVLLKPHKLREPLSGAKAWRGLGAAAAAAGKTDGKLVFVNSMSDLFHEQVPDEYIARVFAVMAAAQRHIFQILTKRPERMRDLMVDRGGRFWAHVAHAISTELDIEPAALRAMTSRGDSRGFLRNVWLGVSIENRKWVGRADILRETPAAVRFISAEPLIGPLVPVSDRRMGDNPVYGGIRGSGVQGSPGWRTGDPVGRHDLARSGPQGQSLDAGHEVAPLRAEAGREQAPERLFAGPGDVRWQARARTGASTGMAPLQSRSADRAGANDQPQERRQGRQSAGELGAGDLLRAGDPRSRGAGASRLPEPDRRGQSSRDADLGEGGPDAGAARQRGDSSGSGDGLRRGVSDGIEDRSERAMGPWLDLTGISWLILGGESGAGHRPLDLQWMRDLRDAARATAMGNERPDCALFVKQLGGHRPGTALEDLPEDLQIREFPATARISA